MAPIDCQQPSVRPDLIIMKDDLDFAVGECGKDDFGGVGKKELVERGLHVPKILKDAFVRALQKAGDQVSLARSLKTVALNNNSKLIFYCQSDPPKAD